MYLKTAFLCLLLPLLSTCSFRLPYKPRQAITPAPTAPRVVSPAAAINPPRAEPTASPIPTQTEAIFSTPNVIATKESKIGSPPPGGRQSLYNSEIQSHLQTASEVETVSGVEMSISDFYKPGSDLYQGHLFVSVCFATRGVEGWQMGPATLRFANGESSAFSGRTVLDQRSTNDGEPGRHCETLEFDMLPAGADLSNLSLAVQSVLLAPPADFHECETFKARWARSERMKRRGIAANCKALPGYTQVTITARPPGMSQEEAQTIAGQEAAGIILGPWTFTRGNLVVAK
jgi:hypothetical protein